MSSTDAAPTTSSEPPPQELSKPQPNPQDPSSPSATTVPSSDVAQSEPETSPAVAPSDVDPITVVAPTNVENVDRQIDVSAPGNAQDGVGHGAINGEGGAQEIVIGHDSSADEGQHWYQEGDNHELKRVKVYELINARWIDQGTAFCFGHYDENTGDALLVARAEASYSEVILQTAIRSSDVYQRQQDTLIVWTEPDGQDYALSFQDPEGCQEVWSFILEVQRIHSTSAESSSPFAGPDSGSITTGSIIRSGHLPSPALGIILEIDKAIKALSRTTVIREKICEYIQRADYLKSMIDVMSQAEDLESLDNLHALCTLMQTILTMNDHAMYEHILEDDIFFGVVGMLEYDPEFPTHKANYREFLRQTTHFHEPVPISDPIISKKIHHTYRLQFLKDVALARILDDSTFNVLNSCIIFNQIDIIAHFQGDPRLLRDIVSLFTAPEDVAFKKEKDSMKMDVDEPSSPRVGGQSPKPVANGATPNGSAGDDVSLAQRRREVVLLVQQLCIMGKNVQLPARMSLFKCLVDRGIIHAVQWALAQPETTEQGKRMISVAGEVLITLLDHDVNGVREHIVRQNEEVGAGSKGESLLNLLCVMMVRSKDLAVQTLVGDALRMVLEMPTPDSNDPVMPTKLFSRLKDEAKIEKFLDNFYQTSSIDTLLKPILDIPEPNHCTESDLVFTRERTNLYLSLCDLLSTFALQHSYRSHFTMIKHSVSLHLITLLHCKDKHLRLAALRYFRVHLKRRNKHFNGHLIKLGVFKALLDLTLEESHRDTLINSCCLELFDTIRASHTHEAYRDIFTHLMTTHEGLVRQLSETKFAGPAFAGLISRWEMAADTSHKEDQKSLDLSSFSNTFDIRRVEEESEDSYFNGDDDDDEDDIDSPPPPLPLTLPNLPNLSPRQHKPKPQTRNWPKRAIGQQKRPITPSPRGLQIPRSPSIDMLMEYGDEDEDLSPVGTIASVNHEEDKNKDREAFVPSPTPSPDLRPVASGDKEAPPATPRISHRHLSTKRSRDDLERSAADAGTDGDSEEDVGMIGPMPLSPSEEKSSGFTPLRPEKRRRQDDEDEDDMILERLATRGKRSSVGGGESPNPGRQSPGKGGGKDEGTVAAGGAALVKAAGGGGDDSPGQGGGPKKIKLKFGSAGMAVASSSPSPAPESRSEPGTKDGDTG